MFQPSQHDVRRFLCDAWRKRRDSAAMTPIETLASLWIAEHPEYDAELSDEQAALAADYSVEGGRANPFLHLSMHLTISEQCSIDQPRGIRAAVEALAAKDNPAIRQREAVVEAKAILTVLDARGISISSAQRQEILICQDADRLDRWLRRSAVASSADEVTSES